jgi:hypothetical protein
MLNFGYKMASQMNRPGSVALIQCSDRKAESNNMRQNGDSYRRTRRCRGSGGSLLACQCSVPGFMVDKVTWGLVSV